MTELPDHYQFDPGFDPAEDHIGPFSFFKDPAGLAHRYGFVAEPHHCNAHDNVHGGVLMTFADFALCLEATDHYKAETCVTVSFNSEFIAAATVAELIEARVSITRKTGSLVFLTGSVFVGDRVVLTFSSIVKRLDKDR